MRDLFILVALAFGFALNAHAAPARSIWGWGTDAPDNADCDTGTYGSLYIETDVPQVYICATDGDWHVVTGSGGGSGDVEGPSSAVDGCIVLFDGTTGKLLKDSGICPDPTKNGLLSLQGTTSGELAFSVANVAGTAVTLIWPADSESATEDYVLSLGAEITCPSNLPAAAPTTCRQLAWVEMTGGGGSLPYSYFSGSQSAVTQTGSNVAAYTVANVPALPAGSCYTIDVGLNADGGTGQSVAYSIYVDGTSIIAPYSGNGVAGAAWFGAKLCNNQGVQNAQTVVAKQFFYGTTTLTPNNAINPTWIATKAIDMSTTHTIYVYTNSASGTITPKFIHITQE